MKRKTKYQEKGTWNKGEIMRNRVHSNHASKILNHEKFQIKLVLKFIVCEKNYGKPTMNAKYFCATFLVCIHSFLFIHRYNYRYGYI